MNIELHVLNETAHDVSQANIELRNEQNNFGVRNVYSFGLKIEKLYLKINRSEHLLTENPTNVNHIGFFVQTIGILQQPYVQLIAILIGVLILASTIAVPLAVILSSSKFV